MARRPRPLLRFLLPLLALVLAAAGLVAWRVSRFYERFLTASLPQWASSASGGLYRITAKRVRVGILGRRITLTDVHLWPDAAQLAALRARGQGPRLLAELHVPELRLRGVVWENLVRRQELHCRRLSVTDPQLRVWTGTDTARAPSGTGSQQRLQALRIQQLDVSGARLLYTNRQPGRSSALFSRDGSLSIEALYIRLPTNRQPARASGRLRIALGQTRYRATPGRHETQIHAIRWVPDSARLILSGVRFAPRAAPEDQRPHIQMQIATVTASGFYLHDLMHQHRLALRQLVLTQPTVTATIDRRLPRRPTGLAAPYPQDLLQHLPVPLFVPQIAVRDGTILYRDISRRTLRPGTLTFKSLNGTLTGLDAYDTARITLSTRFQERSQLRLQAKLALRDAACGFSLTGSLRDLKAYQIRQPAEALALLAILDLQVDEVRFTQAGNKQFTYTQLTGRYSDLRVQVLKADSTTGVLQRRGLASLFANRVVLYPSNPLPGQAVRAAVVGLPRDSTQSFFNTLWAGLFQSIKQIVIADKAVLDRAQAKARTKGERLQERTRRREQRRARRAARRARQPDQD